MREHATRTRTSQRATDLRPPTPTRRARSSAEPGASVQWGSLLDRLLEGDREMDRIADRRERPSPAVERAVRPRLQSATTAERIRGRTAVAAPMHADADAANDRLDRGFDTTTATRWMPAVLPRGPPANDSTLEREADAWADRIVHGARGPPLELHRASLAVRAPIDGSGRALPTAVRAMAEAAWAVDLGAVRLHDGASAQGVLAEHGARGLAFGTDVLVEPGAPTQVLLHELTHVVQQTASAEGRECRRGAGRAGPQALMTFPTKPISMEDVLARHETRSSSSDASVATGIKDMRTALATPVPTTGPKPVVTALATIAKDARDKSATDDFAALACDLLKSSGDLAGAVALLDRRPQLTTVFLFQDLVAAANARKWTDIPAVPARIAQWGWVDKLWRKHPKFEGARPSNFIDVLITPLLDTRMVMELTMAEVALPIPPGSATGTKPVTKYFELYAADELALTTGNTIQNELFLFALDAVKTFNQMRRVLVDDAVKDAKSKVDAVRQRLFIAARFEDAFSPVASASQKQLKAKGKEAELTDVEQTKIAAVDTFSPGVQLLLHAYSAKVAAVARAARLAWEAAFAGLDKPGTTELSPEIGGHVRDLEKHVASAPALESFRKQFLATATQLFANVGAQKDQVPDANDYAKRVKTALSTLATIERDELQKPQDGDARKIRAAVMAGKDWSTSVDAKAVAGRLYAQLMVTRLRERLTEYKDKDDRKRVAAAADAAAKTIAADPRFAAMPAAERKEWKDFYAYAVDYRAAHRVKVARLVLDFGWKLEWGALRDATDPVLLDFMDQVVDESGYGRRGLVLMLVGDWAFEEPKFGDILHDDINATASMEGVWPLRPYDVYLFLQTIEWVAQSGRMRELLKPGGKYVDAFGATRFDLEPDETIPHVLEAERKKRKPPRRWTLENYVFLGTSTSFGDFLGEHPKTRRMLQEESYAGRPFSISTVLPSVPAIIWTTPSYQALIARVRKDVAIDRWLRKYAWDRAVEEKKKAGEKIDAKADPPPLPAMDDKDWAYLFIKALNQQRTDAKAKLPKAKKGEEQPDPKTALGDEAERFYAGLKTEYDKAYEDVISDSRKVAIRTRQYYTQVWLRDVIKQSNKHWTTRVKVKGDKEILAGDIHNRMFMKMISITTMLAPRNDQGAHLWAMVIALAPELDEFWKNRKEFSLLSEWKPIIENAIDMLDKPSEKWKDSSSLDTVQDAGEKARRTTDRQHLVNVNEAWKKQMRSIQRQYGLTGSKAAGKSRGAVRPSRGGNMVVAGKGESGVFAIDGIAYSLIEVYEDFSYFSSYRTGVGLGKREGAEVSRAPPDDAAILFLGAPGEEKEIEPYEDARKPIKLFQYKRKGKLETIDAANDERLREFSNAVGINSSLEDLRVLADALEAVAGVIMDGLELIPGIGQAAAAARIAMAVITIMAGTDFDTLMGLVTKDPIERIKEGASALMETLKPGRLWQFLLFSRFAPKAPPEKEPDTSGISSRNRGAVRRIVTKIARIGKRIVSLFVRFQRKIAAKMDAARLAVLKRPLVARIVRMVARFMHFLGGLDLGSVFATGIDDVIGDVQTGVNNLGLRVRGFFATLGSLTLPGQFIPLDAILSIVVDFIVNRLGGKYKYAAKGFLSILDAMGKKQELYSAIASHFQGSELDPNVQLERHVLPLIRDPVKEGTTKVHGAIKDHVAPAIDKIAGGGKQTPFADGLGTAPDVDVKMDTKGEDIADEDDDPALSGEADPEHAELQPLDDRARAGTGSLPPMPSRTSGRPLPDTTRSDIEGRLGHDLGHVRLHQDTLADQLTSAMGAHAATSGSHVFVRPDVDLATTSGSTMLRHEIGHVLQQTGPRPIGMPASAMPELGAPGRGIHVDPKSEAMADAIADMRRPEPIVLPSETNAGLQPGVLDDVAQPMLTELSSGTRLEERAAKDAKGGAHDAERQLSPDQIARTEQIWARIKRMWRSGATAPDALTFAEPFAEKEASAAIQTLLQSRTKEIEKGIDNAATQSIVFVKPANEGDAAPSLVSPGHLRDQITGLVYGASGIMLDLQFKVVDEEMPTAKRAKQPFVDKNQAVSRLRVVNVDLSKVHGGSLVWSRAIANTTAFHKLGAEPLWKSAGTPEGAALLRARLRGVLADFGGVGIWETKTFAFNKTVLRALKEATESDAKKEIAKADFPTKADYLDFRKVETNKKKNLGLRIGRFIQHSSPVKPEIKTPGGAKIERKGQQKGLDRESHHTTQYLLLELFHNAKKADKRPFPVLHEAGATSNTFGNKPIYPGIKASGGAVSEFKASTRFPLAEFAASRGGFMPAILLAQVTHRSGGLHVSTESADFGETGEDSQGQAVLNRYRDALVAGGGVGAKFRDAEKKALAKTKPATGVPASSPIGEFQAAIDALGRPQVAAEIESAMRSVYTWMYDKKMGPALEHALVEQEMPYFNELAEAFKSPDRINPGDFAPILTEVKKNNVEIMKEAGFAT